MFEITICPSCGGPIKKVKKNWTGSFRGLYYTVPDLEYYECENCGEKVYDRETMRKIESYSPAFARKQEAVA